MTIGGRSDAEIEPHAWHGFPGPPRDAPLERERSDWGGVMPRSDWGTLITF